MLKITTAQGLIFKQCAQLAQTGGCGSHKQVVLVAEIPVYRALTHACRPADVVHGNLVEAAGCEQILGGNHYLPGLWGLNLQADTVGIAHYPG